MIRRVDVKKVPTNRPDVHLEVSVHYDDGNSPFGRSKERGYYLQVSYIRTEDGWRYHELGKGGHGLLEPAARFNQKRMNQLVELAKSADNEPLKLILQHVLERNGLTQAEEPAAEVVESR